MNEYIFYTTEGYTMAPNMDTKVENSQVLGRAYGKTPQEAKKSLIEENQWIEVCGFNIDNAIYRQIATEDLQTKIKQNNEIIEFLVNSLNDGQLNNFRAWLASKGL